MNETVGESRPETQPRQPHIPREGSHGVQWGLLIALVGVMVLIIAGARMLGTGNQLKGTTWTLTGLPQADVELGDHVVTVSFTADEMTGQAPVNGYGGAYSAGGAKFVVGANIARTLMAGPEDAMEVEDAYFAALASATGYVLGGDTLTLIDAAGSPVLAFERAD